MNNFERLQAPVNLSHDAAVPSQAYSQKDSSARKRAFCPWSSAGLHCPFAVHSVSWLHFEDHCSQYPIVVRCAVLLYLYTQNGSLRPQSLFQRQDKAANLASRMLISDSLMYHSLCGKCVLQSCLWLSELPLTLVHEQGVLGWLSEWRFKFVRFQPTSYNLLGSTLDCKGWFFGSFLPAWSGEWDWWCTFVIFNIWTQLTIWTSWWTIDTLIKFQQCFDWQHTTQVRGLPRVYSIILSRRVKLHIMSIRCATFPMEEGSKVENEKREVHALGSFSLLFVILILILCLFKGIKDSIIIVSIVLCLAGSYQCNVCSSKVPIM